MRAAGIATLMVFVDRPGEAARLWAQLMGATQREDDPQLVDAPDVQLFFHAADRERNPQGGTVAYLAVADFDGSRAELLEAGVRPAPGAADVGRRSADLPGPRPVRHHLGTRGDR